MNPTPSKKELMNRSLDALTINIGKRGVNEEVMEEINRQLKNRELIKLRFSKGISSQKQNYISQIMDKSHAKLIDFRGNVAIIFKKRAI